MIFFFYLLNSLFLGGLVYVFWRRQKNTPIKKWFLPALFLKLLSGILIGFFYQQYFAGGDTFSFQAQSTVLTDYFKDNPAAYIRLWFTDSIESETVRAAMVYHTYSNSYFLVLVLSFLNLFTHNQYFLNALYFSLFSFFGAWQLTKTLGYVYPENKNAAILAFLFFPSVVFWSAGITKEAVYIGALCWLISVVLNLVFSKYTSILKERISAVIAAYLLWEIKFYYAAVVFPLLFSFALVTWATKTYPVAKKLQNQVLLFGGCLLILSLLVSQMHHVFELDFFFYQLTENYSQLSVLSQGKPHINYPDLEPTVPSVLWHAPFAVLQATLRPFIWEGDTWFYRIAGLENFILLFLVGGSVVYLWHHLPQRIDVFVCILLVYIFIVGALIGLTTPNLGSLSRYKTAFLPFLVYLLLQKNYLWRVLNQLSLPHHIKLRIWERKS